MSRNDSTQKMDRVIAKARVDRETREQGYRSQALKMYPWICGRCAREFSRRNLHELTVHHRDHDHDNNPSDGSNWELLCVYCHDNEHSRLTDSAFGSIDTKAAKDEATHSPFAELASMLKQKK
ncbi:MAG: YajD family HNH nuclease [Pseudomonadota bacterium]